LISCRQFETFLDALTTGALEAGEASRCRRHAAECEACADLLTLATLEAPPTAEAPSDFVRQVLRRTSGATCSAARDALCAWVDGEAREAEALLVARHVDSCPECRGLVAALVAMRRDLPRLASLSPGERFVADVLRHTLPATVQLRRWWRAAWPRWVHRPRFASEAAFIGLLVLVLVFSTPGSPLEAVPRQALALAQEPPRASGALLEAPLRALGESAAEVADNLRQSEEARAVVARYEAAVETGGRWRRLAETGRARLGTLWREVASLLQTGANEPENATEETIEETS
jgi:anti-sigma factor RsiW